VLEKANQLIRKAEELKARMSETMRYRSDSVVSIDEPALQLGLNGEAVMEEAVLEMLQTNNVEELRKVDADALALATTAKTYALHEACEAGSMDVVRFLLEEAEHDIDIRDAQQWTPLHYAAAFQGDKPELVHYLLSKGADAAHEDEDGDTALDAHLDESDADTVVADLLKKVEEHDGYEHWARAHARAPGLYGELVKAERPKYVEAEVRLAFGVLHAQANTHYDRIKESGVSAEAFILGAHGGHVCFDHVLTFMA